MSSRSSPEERSAPEGSLAARHHRARPAPPLPRPARLSTDLRQLTAHDQASRDTVMDTPGVREVLAATALQVQGYLAGPRAAPLTLMMQCAGGRHRVVDRTTRGHAGRVRIPRLAWSVDVAHPHDEGAQRS
ncbi:RapZ C-terminal domain-containing protein [Streptomyces canarius]|uniref:RapZ C-terminal domain-containing protein n=1 Tax=Streptomyces TaxID=1883 RepID=UPI0035712E23